jgi:hypothetical protein
MDLTHRVNLPDPQALTGPRAFGLSQTSSARGAAFAARVSCFARPLAAGDPQGDHQPQDAQTALDQGVEGVVVSNHGGRHVDRAIAALDALPEVADFAADWVPVLLDSGIRCGSDAFKALSTGAGAVLLARPYLWGLARARAGYATSCRGLR